MSLKIEWAGWAQIRLATDPDPTDELRGVSGFTFAYGDEPDLDRIIRFHDPVAPRTHGPHIGVHVTKVSRAGKAHATHPLIGARVHLMGDAKEEQRNYALMGYGPTKRPYEAIDPLHIRIASDDIVLDRLDLLDPADPSKGIMDVRLDLLERRGFTSIKSIQDEGYLEKMCAVLGFDDANAFRHNRRNLVERDYLRLSQTPPGEPGRDDRLAALKARLDELRNPDTGDRRTQRLGLFATRQIDMMGPTKIVDPDGHLGGTLVTGLPWATTLMMSIFDCDALAMWVEGSWEIPYE